MDLTHLDDAPGFRKRSRSIPLHAYEHLYYTDCTGIKPGSPDHIYKAAYGPKRKSSRLLYVSLEPLKTRRSR